MESKKELLDKGYEIATFAAGCFWGVEAAFRKIEGVEFTQVGYTGGNLENPTYKEVCTGKTGHAEAVEVIYDPHTPSYEKLLEIFWHIHDPTTINRQGPDQGTQYRSAVFYHNDLQKTAAFKIKAQLQNLNEFSTTIVTEITQASEFYRAEEYHQQYFEKHGNDGGCKIHF
jgi:peptide-methionine (S)-S-oxide reductase